MTERLTETEAENLFDRVYKYCLVETIGHEQAAQVLTVAVTSECVDKRIFDSVEVFKKTIPHINRWQKTHKRDLKSSYTNDQRRAFALRFGAELDNPTVAEIMGKSTQKTWNLTLEAVAIYNKHAPFSTNQTEPANIPSSEFKSQTGTINLLTQIYRRMTNSPFGSTFPK